MKFVIKQNFSVAHVDVDIRNLLLEYIYRCYKNLCHSSDQRNGFFELSFSDKQRHSLLPFITISRIRWQQDQINPIYDCFKMIYRQCASLLQAFWLI